MYAATWTDAHENLWLFGGRGHNGTFITIYADLWKYSTDTDTWTWVNGPSTYSTYSYYTAPGHAGGQPGARDGAATWVDQNGHLWLFGGNGRAAEEHGNFSGMLSDIWEYNPNNNAWYYRGGPQIINHSGSYPPAHNQPGYPPARAYAASSVSPSGEMLLFGGTGNSSYLNDLWSYNSTTGMWTWLLGSATPDQPSIINPAPPSSHHPGSRTNMAAWTDTDHNFWIFGGYGYHSASTSVGHNNELWQYSPVHGNFTYHNGSIQTASYPANHGEIGNPGRRNSPAAWYTPDRLWLFGGYATGQGVSARFNDLWAYNPLETVWRFQDGPPAETAGHYPATLHEKGLPPGRQSAQTWTTTNRLYLYGGTLNGANPVADMWYHSTAPHSHAKDWHLYQD